MSSISLKRCGIRFLIITYGFATGGTDRVAVHIANAFAQRFETTLMNVQRPAASSPLTAMIAPGVRRISLDRTRRSRTLNYVAAIFGLIREVRRLRPDVVMATGNNNNLFSALAHLANPNPARRFVTKVTNPIVRTGDRFLRRWSRTALYGVILRRATRILVLSAGEAKIVSSLYPALADRLRIVRNPYVTDDMMAVGDRRQKSGCGLVFLALGRLHPQKGFGLLLDAWAAAGIGRARLRIAGEGPMRDELVARARALNISDSVEFLGYRSDVPDLLGAATSLVLSSHYEGLPAVVLEAFAAGCPVISTDCFPAAGELVETASGCSVVPRRDVAALAAAMIRAAGRREVDVAALQARASAYSISSAAQSHVEALF